MNAGQRTAARLRGAAFGGDDGAKADRLAGGKVAYDFVG